MHARTPLGLHTLYALEIDGQDHQYSNASVSSNTRWLIWCRPTGRIRILLTLAAGQSPLQTSNFTHAFAKAQYHKIIAICLHGSQLHMHDDRYDGRLTVDLIFGIYLLQYRLEALTDPLLTRTHSPPCQYFLVSCFPTHLQYSLMD